MIEDSSAPSLVELYPPLKPTGESSMPLSEKTGGGGIQGYIERARAERDERQRLQDERKRNVVITPARSTPESTFQPVDTTFSSEEEKANVSLDSNNLAAEVAGGKLERTSTGLIKGVALFGSTHNAANWREESTIPALSAADIINYSPRMSQWDGDLHPKAEALALNEMAVLAMRIENHELKDGSLGSMVEIGMAALSAAINGQRLVISFEENIQESLDDPGAQAQFIALQEQLNDIQKLFPGLVMLMKGSSIEEFNKELVSAVHGQESPQTARKPMDAKDFEEHEEKKRDKMKIKPLSVVFGGSSGSFSENPEVVTSFGAEQNIIKGAWGDNVTSLNEPPYTIFWDRVKAIPATNRDGRQRAQREAYLSEEGIKNRNAILVWSIQDEAVSKAAITEVGFLLLKALKEGQQVMIVTEPFNADLYFRTVFKENITELRTQVRKVFVDGFGGEPLSDEQITEANSILDQIEDMDSKDSQAELLGRVKNSDVLKSTKMFWDFDNARRTRSVFDAQMTKLVDGMNKASNERGEPFFTYASSTEQYLQQAEVIKQKYDLAAAA